MKKKFSKIIFFLYFSLLASSAFGQDGSVLGMPALTSSVGENGEATYSLSLQILVLMTVLTVVPSIVLGMTAFTRGDYSFVYFASGLGHSADATQPSANCNCTVYYFLRHESNF